MLDIDSKLSFVRPRLYYLLCKDRTIIEKRIKFIITISDRIKTEIVFRVFHSAIDNKTVVVSKKNLMLNAIGDEISQSFFKNFIGQESLIKI
jgi:hypothetical protein